MTGSRTNMLRALMQQSLKKTGTQCAIRFEGAITVCTIKSTAAIVSPLCLCTNVDFTTTAEGVLAADEM